MTKTKILNIKLGEIYLADLKKSLPNIITAYPKKSKDGVTYYEIRFPIFIKEIDITDKNEKEKTEL
jgi:hypothetical protein